MKLHVGDGMICFLYVLSFSVSPMNSLNGGTSLILQELPF